MIFFIIILCAHINDLRSFFIASHFIFSLWSAEMWTTVSVSDSEKVKKLILYGAYWLIREDVPGIAEHQLFLGINFITSVDHETYCCWERLRLFNSGQAAATGTPALLKSPQHFLKFIPRWGQILQFQR